LDCNQISEEGGFFREWRWFLLAALQFDCSF
jgi:hypothetical protein